MKSKKVICLLIVLFYPLFKAQASSNESTTEKSFLENIWESIKPNTLVYYPISKSVLYNRNNHVSFYDTKNISSIPSYVVSWGMVTTEKPSDSGFYFKFLPKLDFKSAYFHQQSKVYDNEKNFFYNYEIKSLQLFSGLSISSLLQTPIGQFIPKISYGPSFLYAKDSFTKEAKVLSTTFAYGIDFNYFFGVDNLFTIGLGSYGIYGNTLQNPAVNIGGWSNINIGFGWIF